MADKLILINKRIRYVTVKLWGLMYFAWHLYITFLKSFFFIDSITELNYPLTL